MFQIIYGFQFFSLFLPQKQRTRILEYNGANKYGEETQKQTNKQTKTTTQFEKELFQIIYGFQFFSLFLPQQQRTRILEYKEANKCGEETQKQTNKQTKTTTQFEKELFKLPTVFQWENPKTNHEAYKYWAPSEYKSINSRGQDRAYTG